MLGAGKNTTTRTAIQHSQHGGTHGVSRSISSTFVSYEYRVGGERYTGDRAAYGSNGDLNERIARGRLEPGSPIQVHYDPDQPSRSVLVRGVQASTLWTGGLVAALVALASWLLVCTTGRGPRWIRDHV